MEGERITTLPMHLHGESLNLMVIPLATLQVTDHPEPLAMDPTLGVQVQGVSHLDVLLRETALQVEDLRGNHPPLTGLLAMGPTLGPQGMDLTLGLLTTPQDTDHPTTDMDLDLKAMAMVLIHGAPDQVVNREDSHKKHKN
jgi:hypothetical protein